MTTEFISERFVEAHQRFLTDPKTVSDADLEQFNCIDRDLANKARARRAGHSEPAKPGDARPVTRGHFRKWFEDTLSALFLVQHYHLASAVNRLEAAERRLEQLERVKAKTPSGVRWRGVFDAGRAYDEGDLITRAGSLWLATQRSPVGNPGEGVSGWTLICKGR